MGKIPKRWLPYTKFGQRIPGTRFVAFKCPLHQRICDTMPNEKRFTTNILQESLPSLKMVIDVTYAKPGVYYSPADFSRNGLKHVKLFTEGHNVPTPGVINEFFQTVDEFLEFNQEGLIGVHCTHGVNRTGFLICKYMISKLGFEPQNAIKAFREARGHGIERINYITALGINDKNNATELADPEPNDEKLVNLPRLDFNNQSNERRNDDRNQQPQPQQQQQRRPNYYRHQQQDYYNYNWRNNECWYSDDHFEDNNYYGPGPSYPYHRRQYYGIPNYYPRRGYYRTNRNNRKNK